MRIKERTAKLAREVLGRRGVVTMRRWPSDCKKRDVQIPGRAESLSMPTELADKFERHLRSKTPAGRLILALEAEQ